MKKALQKCIYVAGIDEVGRGPLAGPVTVCAVLCTIDFYKKLAKYEGLTDSKKLTEKNREHWFAMAKLMQEEGSIVYAVESVSTKEIDRIGISKAIQKALDSALEKVQSQIFEKILRFTLKGSDTLKFSQKSAQVSPKEIKILLDGSLHAPAEFENQETIIKGDQKEKIISLASIIAKVTRDRYMVKIAKKYPEYGLDIHKGYGTKIHRDAIKKYGLSEIHRKSFCTKILAK